MKISLLSQLAKVIARFHPSEISIPQKGGSSMVSQLYTYLISSPDVDEDEISRHLYPAGSPATYRKLKNRLEDKLLSMLFFIDQRAPKTSTTIRQMTECYKLFAVHFILTRFSLDELSTPIGEKLVKKAKELDLIEVFYPVLRSLRLYYSSDAVDYKKSMKLREDLELAKVIMDDRYFTEQVYCDIFTYYSKSRSSQIKKIKEEIEPQLPKILEIQNRSKSFFVQRRCFNILVLHAQIIGDVDRSYAYCEKALHYFTKESTIYSEVTILNYFVQKLVIDIRRRDYIKGLQNFNQGVALTSSFTRDWNVFYYLKFLLEMHCKKYSEAITTYHEMTEPKNLKNVGAYFQEIFATLHAYVYLVRKHLGQDQPKSLSPTKYVNNIPSFTKDKKGSNLTAVIGQYILMIVQNRQNQATDRMDGLKQYAHRYLRKHEDKRARAFIQALMCIPKGHFHPVTTDKYAEKYLKKLTSSDLVASEQSIELEVIPYEHQWDMLMSHLKENSGVQMNL